MTKIPKHGDPELLPRPTVIRPVTGTGRGGLYDQRGVLLPRGPRFPAAELKAPDIKGLPWRRARGDEWTTARERAWIKDWVATLMRDYRDRFDRWQLIERYSAERSTMQFRDPYFVFRVFEHRTKAIAAEVSVSFIQADIQDEERFKKRLSLARQALEAQL